MYQGDMLSYVCQNIIRAHLFIFPQDIINSLFDFNYFLAFKNSISKINKIAQLTLQRFFYTQWYSIVRLGLFYTSKDGHETTETIYIKRLLMILEHWVITAKLKFLHTFWISYRNLKYFKFICILCIVMDLK